MRKDQIAKFKGAFPGAEVGIDHTGGGCFWLSIRWDNDPVFYVLTDGEASLPSDDEGFPIADGWGYVGRHADDEEPAEDAPQEEWDLFYGIPLYYDEEFTINDNLAIDYILRDRAERKETANA